jgi:hypothetical protein
MGGGGTDPSCEAAGRQKNTYNADKNIQNDQI